MASRTSRHDSKSDAQQFHAIGRLRQRYGLQVSCNEYFRIVHCINQPDRLAADVPRPRLIMKQSNRVSIWSVPYAGRELVAVYDRGRRRISTFLPPDCDHPDAIGWQHFDNEPDAWAERWESRQWGEA